MYLPNLLQNITFSYRAIKFYSDFLKIPHETVTCMHNHNDGALNTIIICPTLMFQHYTIHMGLLNNFAQIGTW